MHILNKRLYCTNGYQWKIHGCLAIYGPVVLFWKKTSKKKRELWLFFFLSSSQNIQTIWLFYKVKKQFFFLRFWLYFGTCGILIPQLGTEPEPPALETWSLPSIFPSIRVCPSESVLRIRWPKYWSFSFSISPSNEYSGLISFRIQCFLTLTLMSNYSQENQLSVSFFI